MLVLITLVSSETKVAPVYEKRILCFVFVQLKGTCYRCLLMNNDTVEILFFYHHHFFVRMNFFVYTKEHRESVICTLMDMPVQH